MLGGALVLAIITAVMNQDLDRSLSGLLNPSQLAAVFRSAEVVARLPEPLHTAVKETFMKGFNMQLRILIGFAAAEVPFTLMMWQKDPVKIG